MHCNHWFRSNVLYWFRAKESESVLLFWFSKGYWEIVTARLAEIFPWNLKLKFSHSKFCVPAESTTEKIHLAMGYGEHGIRLNKG